MPWWQYAREHYLSLHTDEMPTTTTMYYDPIVDVHHRVPASMGQVVAWYAGPQVPDDARRLFEAGIASAGLDAGVPQLPLRAARGYPAALAMAREWEMPDLEERLAEAIEASYQPTWDAASGEFTWGLGLDEPHPRGQFNAFLAAAEASGPGRWDRLSAAPIEPCRQVTGVDFPTMALRRAEWEGDALQLSLAPVHDDPEAWTTFQIDSAGVDSWTIAGADGATVDVLDGVATVRTPLTVSELRITP